MKKIPYGVSSFKQIIEKNMYYIDKTKYIEILENKEEYQFFIRPRRFGKSLFLSMLETYYDINEKDNFDKYFDGLYIQKNKTDQANKFIVLKIDFSTIITGEGKGELVDSFDYTVTRAIKKCFRKYRNIFDEEKNFEISNRATQALEYFIDIADTYDQKVIVLIDEYDNFANNIMSKDRELFIELLNDTGYVRTFYKTLKVGTTTSISRIFMTGVSPISLDEMTSGANIFANITNKEDLNAMIGFTKEEVEEIINYYELDKKVDREKLLYILQKYCNGYKFNQDVTETMYNTDMVFYIVNEIINTGKYPRNLIDSNMKTDYTRLREISSMFVDKDTILKIMETGKTMPVELKEKFNLESLADKENSFDNMRSLLYYLGFLTIDKQDGAQTILKIPNYAVKNLYWEYLISTYQNKDVPEKTDIRSAMRKMRLEGKLEDVFKVYTDYRRALSNRDLMYYNEFSSKLIFTFMVKIDNTYIIESEKETNGGYADIYLRESVNFEDAVNYNYLIEFKHIKNSELKGNLAVDDLNTLLKNNKNTIEENKQQAKKQLDAYIRETNVIKTTKKVIKKLIIITLGKQHVLYEEV